MKVRYTYAIVGILMTVSIMLAYDALTSYINPYLPIREIRENGTNYLHREVQVLGTVANGSLSWTEDRSVNFQLTDGSYYVEVSFVGSLPQDFQEGQQVVVIGEVISSERIEASQMLVKCPSKYEDGGASPLSDPLILIALIMASVTLVYYIVYVLLKRR